MGQVDIGSGGNQVGEISGNNTKLVVRRKKSSWIIMLLLGVLQIFLIVVGEVGLNTNVMWIVLFFGGAYFSWKLPYAKIENDSLVLYHLLQSREVVPVSNLAVSEGKLYKVLNGGERKRIKKGGASPKDWQQLLQLVQKS